MSGKLEWGPSQVATDTTASWRVLARLGTRGTTREIRRQVVGWVLKFPAGYYCLTYERNDQNYHRAGFAQLAPEGCDAGPFDTEEEAMTVMVVIVRLTHKEEAP